MRPYLLESGGVKHLVVARDTREALRKFYLFLKRYPEEVEKIAVMVRILDGKREYYAFTLPVLVGLGLVSKEDAIRTLVRLNLDVSVISNPEEWLRDLGLE